MVPEQVKVTVLVPHRVAVAEPDKEVEKVMVTAAMPEVAGDGERLAEITAMLAIMEVLEQL